MFPPSPASSPSVETRCRFPFPSTPGISLPGTKASKPTGYPHPAEMLHAGNLLCCCFTCVWPKCPEEGVFAPGQMCPWWSPSLLQHSFHALCCRLSH